MVSSYNLFFMLLLFLLAQDRTHLWRQKGWEVEAGGGGGVRVLGGGD